VGIQWNIAIFDIQRTDTLQIHSAVSTLGTDLDTSGRISRAAGEKVIALCYLHRILRRLQLKGEKRPDNTPDEYKPNPFVPETQILLEGSMRVDEIGQFRVAD
jgi:hypothetical protein